MLQVQKSVLIWVRKVSLYKEKELKSYFNIKRLFLSKLGNKNISK